MANEDSPTARKQALRREIRAERHARPAAEQTTTRNQIGRAIRRWCAAQLTLGSTIASYQAMPDEPLPPELADELAVLGFQVIEPVVRADRDLDWMPWTSDGSRSPVRLGLDALAQARLILVPAFAVDAAGHRLGRGGGSYDRALARVTAGATVAAVVYESEVRADVPVDDWDRPVNALVTPAGLRTLIGL